MNPSDTYTSEVGPFAKTVDTFLVHLNVTVPAGASLESVVAQIEGALEVGLEGNPVAEHDGGVSSVDVVLAEEV